jgi:hypothetical protein
MVKAERIDAVDHDLSDQLCGQGGQQRSVTGVRHCHDDQFGGGCDVGVAAAGDSTGVVCLCILGGHQLPALGGAATNQDVVPGSSKSPRKATALGPGAAQDPYLHADARRCLARSGRVALRAGRMVMGSIVMRGPRGIVRCGVHRAS